METVVIFKINRESTKNPSSLNGAKRGRTMKNIVRKNGVEISDQNSGGLN